MRLPGSGLEVKRDLLSREGSGSDGKFNVRKDARQIEALHSRRSIERRIQNLVVIRNGQQVGIASRKLRSDDRARTQIKDTNAVSVRNRGGNCQIYDLPQRVEGNVIGRLVEDGKRVSAYLCCSNQERVGN